MRDAETRSRVLVARWVFAPMILLCLAETTWAIFDLNRPDRSTAADALVPAFCPLLTLVITPVAIWAWRDPPAT